MFPFVACKIADKLFVSPLLKFDRTVGRDPELPQPRHWRIAAILLVQICVSEFMAVEGLLWARGNILDRATESQTGLL